MKNARTTKAYNRINGPIRRRHPPQFDERYFTIALKLYCIGPFMLKHHGNADRWQAPDGYNQQRSLFSKKNDEHNYSTSIDFSPSSVTRL